MKTLPESEGVARFAARILTDRGEICTSDDIASRFDATPSHRRMGVQIGDRPWPHEFVAVWLNGLLGIFRNDVFREWAKDHPTQHRYNGSAGLRHMKNKKDAVGDEISYHHVYDLRRAGSECGLVGDMIEVTREEIMATLEKPS